MATKVEVRDKNGRLLQSTEHQIAPGTLEDALLQVPSLTKPVQSPISRRPSAFTQVKSIVTGWSNWLLGKEQSLSDKRMAICKNCDNLSKAGTCKLCGCMMEAKTRNPEAKCPDTPARW